MAAVQPAGPLPKITTLACSIWDMENLGKSGDLISGTREKRSSRDGVRLFLLPPATLLLRKRCNCHEARRCYPHGATKARCDRPSDLGRATGRWPNDQCGA